MAKGDGKRIEKLLLAVSGEVVGVLQMRAWQAITSATPVDTGFARGSVTPSVGSPIVRLLERPSNPQEAAANAARNFGDNQARARKIQSSYQVSQGRVWIVMRAGYFVYLNAGSSAQAPAMFVERAVAQAVLSLRTYKPRAA